MKDKAIKDKLHIEINKLKAHTEHLLDGFITLRERYAMLRPMLHNNDVVKNKGSKKQSYGFIIIRNTLFLSCCQLIANLCFDKDHRCPSIIQIISILENVTLRNNLKAAYALSSRVISDNDEPEILELWKRIEAEDQHKLGVEFDNNYNELLSLWYQFNISKPAASLADIRNKVTAHSDISLINGKFRLFDINALNLKWTDILETVNTMQKIIELINLIVRSSGFAWEYFDKNLEKKVNDYWEISPISQ